MRQTIEMIIGKVIFEISRKNDVHNNYETDYNNIILDGLEGDTRIFCHRC